MRGIFNFTPLSKTLSHRVNEWHQGGRVLVRRELVPPPLWSQRQRPTPEYAAREATGWEERESSSISSSSKGAAAPAARAARPPPAPAHHQARSRAGRGRPSNTSALERAVNVAPRAPVAAASGCALIWYPSHQDVEAGNEAPGAREARSKGLRVLPAAPLVARQRLPHLESEKKMPKAADRQRNIRQWWCTGGLSEGASNSSTNKGGRGGSNSRTGASTIDKARTRPCRET